MFFWGRCYINEGWALPLCFASSSSRKEAKEEIVKALSIRLICYVLTLAN